MPKSIRTAQELLRQVYGVEPTPGEHIQTTLARELFLETDLGVWATIHPDGITLGAIVEGSEAEIGPYRLVFPFTAQQFRGILQLIQAEAADMFWVGFGPQNCDLFFVQGKGIGDQEFETFEEAASLAWTIGVTTILGHPDGELDDFVCSYPVPEDSGPIIFPFRGRWRQPSMADYSK
jgi:hypothetical protein